jgi:hypothetical protein
MLYIALNRSVYGVSISCPSDRFKGSMFPSVVVLTAWGFRSISGIAGSGVFCGVRP